MTAAVCIACGAMKLGTFTECQDCRHHVTTDEDRARALLLSDRYLDAAELAKASAVIKGGGTATFDEQQVTELTAAIAKTPTPSTAVTGMFVLGFLVAVGAVGLMIVLVIRWAIITLL